MTPDPAPTQDTPTRELASRLRRLRDRMAEAAGRADRSVDDIRLVAVTKTHPVDVIRRCLALGIRDVGENKVQEAVGKIETLAAEGMEGPGHGHAAGDIRAGAMRYHLIGHLQTNKARQAVRHFDLIHSMDSLKLAEEIDAMALKHARSTASVLMQINVSGEDTKGGFEPGNAAAGLETILREHPHLRVEGFMTMAPYSDDPESSRPVFKALASLARRLRMTFADEVNFPGRELSMGMTGDFETAIEEGATIIRVGSALFGERGTTEG